ncbi:MAG: 16S rRNA (adenine(1518)-N(6)/adenine(1519)-N(6))-dimethyltransferase RsmA [Planctomycetota bacterium]
MQTLAEIKQTLAERGLAPRKSLGQNFLIDHNLTNRLVDASGVAQNDLVLEVGPGTGVLTDALLARGARVVASELDRGLSDLLRERFEQNERFRLVEGDCLESKRQLSPGLAAALGDEPFTLVANLPYGAGTPLMVTLLADHAACRGQFVTVQREVADRLAASPGTKAYGSISILAALTCHAQRLATLPPACFWPRPEVTSAMIALTPRDDAMPREDRRHLLDTCQTLFASRRKQIGGVLRRLTPPTAPETRGEPSTELLPDGIDPTSRVETLTPAEILAIAARLR